MSGDGRDPAQRCDGGQHHAYEHELPEFDPDIERQKRQRNIALWQTDILQRTGEGKAVEQTEQERHDPWPADRHACFSIFPSNGLHRDQLDAGGDQDLDGTGWQAHQTERRQHQRDRMRQREGGYGFHQHPPIADDQQKRRDEEQMIDALKDMLDFQQQTGLRDFKCAALGIDLYPRARGAH